jgi:hypothetical protein
MTMKAEKKNEDSGRNEDDHEGSPRRKTSGNDSKKKNPIVNL